MYKRFGIYISSREWHLRNHRRKWFWKKYLNFLCINCFLSNVNE